MFRITKISHNLKFLKRILHSQKYVKIATILLLVLLFKPLYYSAKIFVNDQLNYEVENKMSELSGMIFVTPVSYVFDEIKYQAEKKEILFRGSSFNVNSIRLAYKYLIIFVISFFFLPIRLSDRIKYFLFGICVFILLNYFAVLSVFFINRFVDLKYLYELLFVFYIVYIFARKVELRSLEQFLRTSHIEWIQTRLIVRIIIIVLLIEPISGLLIHSTIGDLIRLFVIECTNLILLLFGYSAHTNHEYVYSQATTIFVDNSCLGIKLLLTYIAVLVLSESSLRSKLVFSIIGVFGVTISNVIRIAILFINIETNGNYTLAISYHDLFNVFIYIVVVALWLVWFKYVSDFKVE